MKPAQQNHRDSIAEEAKQDIIIKYDKGAKEHGGNLWQKSGMVHMALEETTDLETYLRTLKKQHLDYEALLQGVYHAAVKADDDAVKSALLYLMQEFKIFTEKEKND